MGKAGHPGSTSPKMFQGTVLPFSLTQKVWSSVMIDDRWKRAEFLKELLRKKHYLGSWNT